ncbi:MAG TPA: DUF5666 domain-containing protein [Candidatus Limnocylindrales bacterium]|nr:DUF5666 domain-containing protein [Candidatus Limnocylindrales bacterium]
MTQSTGPAFSSRLPGANPIRVAIVAGVLIVLALSAAITLAASPSPAGPNGSSGGSGPSTPSGSPAPKHGGPLGFGFFGRGFGPGAAGGPSAFGGIAGGFGGAGVAGGVTIASIDGSTLSLKTADGWTRTITVTSATKITRAGQTIDVSGLKAGDTIAFRESKASDGSYTIEAISVVLPRVFGQVTATTADTITIKQFGGTTTTIHVSSTTTFQIFGVSKPTIAALKAGMTITAEGTQAGDGSFDALSVSGFQLRFPRPGGQHVPGGNGKPKSAPASAAPGA